MGGHRLCGSDNHPRRVSTEHTMKISKYLAGMTAISAMVAGIVLSAGGARAGDLRGRAPTLSITEQHNLTAIHSTLGAPAVTAPQSFVTTATQPVTANAVAAKAVTAAPMPPGSTPAGSIEVRDHRPGGNADPCWGHTCDQGSELKSIIAHYQNTPPTASFCARGFPAGACYQGFAYPDGTGHTKTFYIAFAHLGGPPLAGQLDKFLNALRSAEGKYKGPTYKSLQTVPPAQRTAEDPMHDHRH
jgi:hypothetical protein